MSSETPSHPNYKLHKKLMRRRAIRESWPLLVWLGVAALGVWAYQTGGEFNRMRGIVTKPVETIAADITGRLLPLPEGVDAMLDSDGAFAKLEQGVFVDANKVVAKIDDKLIVAEMAAEKQKTIFDNAKLQQELQKQISDFTAQISLLDSEQKVVQSEIDAEKKVLASYKKALGVTKTESDVQVVQARIETLEGTLSGVRQTMASTEKLVQDSNASIQKLSDLSNIPDTSNDVLLFLQAKIDSSVIRNANSGYIDKVYAKPGSVVKAGDPIMDIVVKQPKTITAMIPEQFSLNMKVGDTAYIAIPNNRKEYVTATVVSLQQSLSQIPDYGSPIRGRMVRGRLVEFGNLGGNDEESQLPLLPGSEVVVSLKPPGRIPFLSWFSE
ncbi:HlyD family efflux transporter periplasmic adaptor subunit [Verrucomicrobiales bacterium]|nr:HlyD family efflux transporter periplasmic adaptor subunit [Verrucomicrobiales bacterium]MDB4730066.1 HlyD family efflux transporter periplasmic adaptor subunit [bacterium]